MGAIEIYGILILIIYGAMLAVLGGILIAIKSGFNEVIRGLESIDERLATRSAG